MSQFRLLKPALAGGALLLSSFLSSGCAIDFRCALNPSNCSLSSLGLSNLSGSSFVQQGAPLFGTGGTGTSFQGSAVALSGDGNTAVIGGWNDNTQVGGFWVFVRSGVVWSPQAGPIVGTGMTMPTSLGYSIAVSGDGNTVLAGGPQDNSAIGAVWVFTRSGTVWTQEAGPLIGTGAVGAASQGSSVSLSTDGNTALVGGMGDNGWIGAAWVFTRSGTVWTQQGGKLVGSGVGGAAWQGVSVALSGDGDTAIIGGDQNNSGQGAFWVFARSGGVWNQEAGPIDPVGGTGAPNLGHSASLSSDGNIALVGARNDNVGTGAFWSYTRSGGVWSQEAGPITATGNTGGPNLGQSISMTLDGSLAIVGGYQDNGSFGAAWIFSHVGGTWIQSQGPMIGTGATGVPAQGSAVAMSGDGTTALSGGFADNGAQGGTWVFSF